MTENQLIWARARDRLAEAFAPLGYPPELAGLLAGQLKSPRAIDRMTSFVRATHPRSMEMIADEMLAISQDVQIWREKKESQAAQASYSAWLSSEERWQNLDEEEA